MAGKLVSVRVAGANPVPRSQTPRQAARKASTAAKASVKAAKKASRAATKTVRAESRKAKAKPRKSRAAKPRKTARKTPTGANDLSRQIKETLRAPASKAYSAKTGTRKAKATTRKKEDDMAAKKRSKKRTTKRAPKKRAAKRKATPKTETTAERSAASKKGARKRTSAQRKASAKKAAATRKRNERSGKPAARKSRSKGKSRSKSRKGKVRRKTAATITTSGIGKLTIRRNPEHIAGTVVVAGAAAGFGYTVADSFDRWFATSKYSAEYKAAYPTDATDNPASLTGSQAAAAIKAYSWTRVGISAGLSAASLALGMYGFKSGYARTAFVWIGIGAAAKAGASVFGKWLMPMLFHKNDTFRNRLAPEEVTIYEMQHPDTGDARMPTSSSVSGAGSLAGCGCGGGDDCGCASCTSKRLQELQQGLDSMRAQTPNQLQSSLVTPDYARPQTPTPAQSRVNTQIPLRMVG